MPFPHRLPTRHATYHLQHLLLSKRGMVALTAFALIIAVAAGLILAE